MIIILRLIFKPFQKVLKTLTKAGGVASTGNIPNDVLSSVVKDLTDPVNPIGALLSLFPQTQQKLLKKPESAIGLLKLAPAAISIFSSLSSVRRPVVNKSIDF